MSSEQPRRGRESSGSPLGSTAAIVIAIVAVVAGFLILRQINDDDDDTLDTGADVTTDAGGTIGADGTGNGSTLPATETVPTTAAIDTTTSSVVTTKGALVVVANASSVNGAAGQLTTALTGQEFDLVAATNATQKLDVSRVFYDPANAQAQAVATSVATLMGVAEVLPLESPAPVDGGALQGGATVLVMLGSDKASQTLEQMGASTTPATATTVAGGTTTAAAVATTTG
jgi:hypothetical protein